VSGVTTLATLDAPLLTPTGNIIEQRNGTSAQTTYLFNTYTDAGNYERLTTYWSGNVAFIQIEQAGTGGNRQLKVGTVGTGTLFFKTWGADRWQIPAAGHLLAVADNTYDIGAAGATRPRNLFVGGAVATGVKAGAPVDADVNTPTDGMLRVDTTNHRLYVRDGGTWRYATLT
jgi:hypothetical protein